MGQVGDDVGAATWRAATQIYALTARLRGKSPKAAIAQVAAEAAHDPKEAVLDGAAAANGMLAWLRSGTQIVDTVRRVMHKVGIGQSPAVAGLFIAESALGAVGIARLPRQMKVARASLLKAIKTGSREDQLNAIDTFGTAASTATGGAMAFSAALWAWTDRLAPYLRLKHVLADAGVETQALHRVASHSLAAAVQPGTVFSPFAQEATAELAKGTSSFWSVLANRIFGAVPVVYAALEGLKALRTHLDPKASTKEKRYADLAFGGSALTATSSVVSLATAGAATGLMALIGAPAVTGTAAVLGAAAWLYATYKKNQLKAARET